MEDRQYQINQVNELIEQIENKRTVLNQLPTGGGKTVEFALFIKLFLQKLIKIEHGPCLILVHREELLKQTAITIKEVLGFDPCLITSSSSRFYLSRVYVGMVESTLPRLHMIVNPSLIIIDECHMQNFNKIHKAFPTTKVIGFSATPIYVSKKDPLKNYYKAIVTGPSIKELIAMGFLSQNLTKAPSSSVDASEFTYDRLTGDYNERQMAEVYRMSGNVSNCIHQYHKHCLRKKTLIFNVNIEHSKEVNECFVACGYNARHLDASSSKIKSSVINPNTGKEFNNLREEIFYWFKTTPDAIMNSVMIPTMGFDEPTVQSVILNYSTMSLVKFIQTCGRGSRVINDYFIEKHQIDYPYQLKTKYYFDILDLGQNWKRFGDWNDERDWKYIFNHPDRPTEGLAPVKTCPSCESLVHAAVRNCPFCGHEFEKKKMVQSDLEEMILITKGVNLDALVEKSGKKYEYYGMFELAVDLVNQMFIQYYNPTQLIVQRYFKTYYSLCIEWYKRTLAGKPGKIEDITDSGFHIKKARHNFNSLIKKKKSDAEIIAEDIPYDLIRFNEEEYAEVRKERESRWKNHKETAWT